ncbi:HNH endonuclease [Bacillus sp. D386]|uniref:HNH endonuclease n=1 Tax=Bacillus sp. D386 TaxID=2587155 RepID=UPI001121E7F4|nr:HNH endonuclease [Bacillus sp. D386]
MIFIFSGKEGKIYGYEDGWNNEGTYVYTGEGQVGDQVFKEGNKALRDHVENGKDVFLFEKNDKNGLYRFDGQLTLIGHHFDGGPDKFGNMRRVIIFNFANIKQINPDTEVISNIIETNDLEELRKIAQKSNFINTHSIKERKQIIRKRSAAVKKYALVRSKGICEACNQGAPFFTIEDQPLLEVHHLYRLSDGGIDHPENVAAICPNCHRRVHYGNDKIEYNNKLISIINKKEKLLNN